MSEGVAQAEGNLKKLGATVTKHPVAALAVLGAALATAAYKAAQFADQINGEFRKVGATLPEATGHLREMRDEIVALTRTNLGEFFDVQQLSAGLAEAARTGTDAAGAMELTREAAKGAAATSGELSGTIEALDAVTDAYGESAGGAARAMDKLVVAQQAGVAIGDLIPILEKSAANARSAGVSFDELVAAAVAMKESGQTTRQIGSVFNRAFGDAKTAADESAVSMERLASQVTIVDGHIRIAGAGAEQYRGTLDRVTNSVGATDRAIQSMTGSLEGQEKRIRNEMSAAWLQFGDVVLPIVTKELKGIAGLLEMMTGANQPIADAANLTTLRTVTAHIDKLTAPQREAALQRLSQALRNLIPSGVLTGAGGADFIQKYVAGADRETLRAGAAAIETMQRYAKELRLGAGDAAALARAAQAMNAELGKRPGPPPSAPAGPRGATPRILSPQEVAKQSELLQQARQEVAGLTQSLADDVQAKLDKMVADARERFTALGTAIPAELQRAIEQVRGHLTAVRAFEPLERDVEALGLAAQQAAGDIEAGNARVAQSLIAQYDAVIARTEEQLALAKEGTDDKKKFLDLLRAERAQREQIVRSAAQADLGRFREDADRALEAATRAVEQARARVADAVTAGDRNPRALVAAVEEAKRDLVLTASALAATLDVRIAADEAALAALAEGTPEHGRLVQQLKQEREERERILRLVKDTQGSTKDGASAHKRTTAELQAQARNIEAAARGAIQLAQAFGLVDESSARALESIAQIAANMTSALSGDLTGVLGVVGGLASLVGSIGGESPEEKRRKEVLAANTDALRLVAAGLRDFGRDLSGERVARERDAVLAALRAGRATPSLGDGIGGSIAQGQAIKHAIQEAGLSMAEFREVAKSLGVEFAGQIPNMKELHQVLQAMAAADITRFRQSFTGQLEALRVEFDLFDITDPIEQLKRLRAVLAGEFGAPALAALKDFDLSTSAGRAQAEAFVQDLFRQLQAGTLSVDSLGGLSFDQFLQALTQFETLIDQANQGGGGGGQSQQFEVNRSITETTGSRIAAFLSTGVLWQEQTARNTASMASVLDSLVTGGVLLPPTEAELDRMAGAGAITVGDVYVTVTPPDGTSADDGAALGAAAGRALVDTLNTDLGTLYRRRKLGRGDITSR